MKMHQAAERKEFLPCHQCRGLRIELVRCQREAEQRAVADAQKCHAIYEHMERLALLNMSLLQRRPMQQHQQGMRIEAEMEMAETELESVDSRLQQLQATIVKQAKEIERLRHQIKNMVPMLPLDGVVVHSDDESDSVLVEDTQAIDETGQPRRGLQKLPLTSLHAHLRARDATIHRLEQQAAQLLSQLDLWREKKRVAVQQYQQITKAQQTQLKKYAAQIQAQMRMQRQLERRNTELQEYIDALEKRLLGYKASVVADEAHRVVVRCPQNH